MMAMDPKNRADRGEVPMRALLRVCTLAFAFLCLIGIVRAQNAAYPNRPIKMLVGFAAGGGTDVAARIIAQKMSEILGQSIVVENRTGASGLLAAQDLAKSAPTATR
jgi:tripartite-type tricarboxylate transporter receptor subunit TctC